MKIREGAKVSQTLVNAALDNPNITFGFEAEMFLVGVGGLVKKQVHKNAKRFGEEGLVGKKIGDASWHDIQRYFVPLAMPKLNNDDQTTRQAQSYSILQKRLIDIYHQTFKPGQTEKKVSEMFQELRSRFKVSHIITMLRVFPLDTSGDEPVSRLIADAHTAEGIKSAIGHGNPLRVQATYPNLDDMAFKMYDPGEEELHFSAGEHLANRDVVYELMAKAFEKVLGEPVIFTATSEKNTARQSGYRKWVLMYDDSLAIGEDGFDVVAIELISPVKVLRAGLDALEKVFALMLNPAPLGIPGLKIETTSETGFHANMGIRGARVDVVKMLFLMGDTYILRKYGRYSNDRGIIAAPSFSKMVRMLGGHTASIYKLIALMQRMTLDRADVQEMIKLFAAQADKISRYQSVNLTKLLAQGYIEFRAIGNKNYHLPEKGVMEMMNHLAVMLLVATDPEVYKKEYLSKLYKVAQQVIADFRKEQDFDYDMKPRAVLP